MEKAELYTGVPTEDLYAETKEAKLLGSRTRLVPAERLPATTVSGRSSDGSGGRWRGGRRFWKRCGSVLGWTALLFQLLLTVGTLVWVGDRFVRLQREVEALRFDKGIMSACTRPLCKEDAIGENYTVRRSDQRDLWCTGRSADGKRLDKMFLAGLQDPPNTYNYFKQAPWMPDGEASKYFNFLQRHIIEVKTAGMYLIEAKVHFLEHDAVMRVVKRPRDTEKLMVLGSCLHSLQTDESVPDNPGATQPCSVSMVSYFQANDRLLMDFNGHKLFWVRKDLLYMTVTELNDFAV